MCHGSGSPDCHDMFDGTAPLGDARKHEVWYSTNYFTQARILALSFQPALPRIVFSERLAHSVHKNCVALSPKQLAVSRIEEHNTSDPLWIHLCYQGVHAGADPMPPAWERISEGAWRSQFYGSMLAVVDGGIGNVTAALRDSGLWQNTILLVAADNGGDMTRQKGDDGIQCEGHGACTMLVL